MNVDLGMEPLDNIPAIAKRLDVTYRQIDHWARKGYIRCDIHHPGSGTRRALANVDEYRVLQTAVRLMIAGFRADFAFGTARSAVDPGWTSLHVSDAGVRITLEPAP